MELVRFRPCPDTEAQVEGWLHTPITEMAVRREQFPTVVVCPGGGYEKVSQREADRWPSGFSPGGTMCSSSPIPWGRRPGISGPCGSFRRRWPPAGAAGMALRPGARRGVRVLRRGASGGLPGHPVGRPGIFENLRQQGWEKPAQRHGAVLPGHHRGRVRPCGVHHPCERCQPGTPGYEYFSLDKHVSGTTCPAFLWHTVTDDCVPVENTPGHDGRPAPPSCAGGGPSVPGRGARPLGVHRRDQEPGPLPGRWMDLCLDWLDHTFQFAL